MLPESGNILAKRFEIVKQPSKTYRLKDGRIRGYVDGLEAVRQAVYGILNTERFDWLVYSWNYGVELNRVYGKSPGLLESKIKKRIREALMQDGRVRGVGAFSFSKERGKLLVGFTVSCDLGEFEAVKEVELDG